MGITIEGIEELQKNLETFKGEAKDVIVSAVFEGCRVIANEAKLGHELGAHSTGRYQNRTGNLTNSINEQKPQISETKIRGEVIVGMNYAAVVELGGTHTSESGKTWESRPYPYLFPAFEKYKSAINEGIKNLLKAIKWVN